MPQSVYVETAEEAMRNPDYTQALKDLLLQMADDDYLLSYRGSEWLGLAPHIEEDVAFSSMSQDMMGHAVMLYEMLEELGAGKADDLAHLRESDEFRNSVLLERPNGPGNYADEPHYDWAYAIIRCLLYGIFKQIRLEVLTWCSYVPLAQNARKMQGEHHYHMRYWESWFQRLALSTDEARSKLTAALQEVWNDIGDLFLLGRLSASIVHFSLIEDESILSERWIAETRSLFASVGIDWPGDWGVPTHNGREGEHTHDLVKAIRTMSEVYRLDPAASW